MKKICILTSVHPALDVRIFYKEAKSLIKADYDITLIAPHNRDETIDGVKIIALPKPKNKFFRILFLTKKLYKIALEQKADIYHFHDPELLLFGYLLKKKTSAKVIYDVHEDVPEQFISRIKLPQFFKRFLYILLNLFEKQISKKFDYIIAATDYIKKRFKPNKIIDIKNYPIVTFLSQNFSKERKLLRNKNQYTLIYIGGFSKERGIKEIIETLELLNLKYNVKLRLAGQFSDKYFEEIKKLEGWEKVDFLGLLPYKQIPQEIKTADIGLVCLHPEFRFLIALPIKLFEYMAVGLPVVASNFPLWKEIVERNNCGICVNPLDPKEIAKAIEYLIKHPEEAQKMGENGRKAVLEKYNWENEEKKLLKIYEELSK